jgi:ADP-heptose:LPS heptosyltransferase
VLLGSLSFEESFGAENDPRFLPADEARFLPDPVRTLVPYPASAPAGHCREIEAHRRVVERCLGRVVHSEEVTPALEVPGAKTSDALVFCPFSSAVSKDFPVAAWPEVFAALSWKGPVQLCGTPADSVRLERLAATLRARGWKADVQPTTDLDALVAVLAAARAVLGVDSAPAHFATALDRPGVFLIGGGHWGMFAPWRRSPRQVWLTNELPCFHCDWVCPYPTSRCITEIPPAQIAAALDTVLRASLP